MSTQVRSETSRQKNKKNITKKKTKRKLELALNFFFYFDPVCFHLLQKRYQKKDKAKKYLRLKIKTFKFLLSKYLFKILCNKEQRREKNFLILKHYFNILKSFNQKKLKKPKIKSINLVKSLSKYKYSLFLANLICLEDFLSI